MGVLRPQPARGAGVSAGGARRRGRGRPRLADKGGKLGCYTNMFDGATIHKLYRDVGIVFRGRVLQFDPNKRYWRIRYDADSTESDFDYNDMENYAIKYIGQ
eukprot:COSAG01_NODE_33408_length_564_cov_3.404301_1_plen_102_part_00